MYSTKWKKVQDEWYAIHFRQFFRWQQS
jgi:hypothetical protein